MEARVIAGRFAASGHLAQPRVALPGAAMAADTGASSAREERASAASSLTHPEVARARVVLKV